MQKRRVSIREDSQIDFVTRNGTFLSDPYSRSRETSTGLNSKNRCLSKLDIRSFHGFCHLELGQLSRTHLELFSQVSTGQNFFNVNIEYYTSING